MRAMRARPEAAIAFEDFVRARPAALLRTALDDLAERIRLRHRRHRIRAAAGYFLVTVPRACVTLDVWAQTGGNRDRVTFPVGTAHC